MSHGPARRPRIAGPSLPTGIWCTRNMNGVLMFSAVTMIVPRVRVIAGTVRLRALST
jgi:hypothetical protein